MKLNAFVAGFLIFALSAGLQLHSEQVGGGQESFESIKAEAEKGNAQAQYKLGSRYYTGEGVKRDYPAGVKWFRKAAEQGDLEGQFALGSCYADGEGVSQDNAEAVKWFRKAAEQGDAMAQHNVGSHYYDGRGVAQDFAEAAKWFRKAAEQGILRAQSRLGLLYAQGLGVTKDHVEAARWWRKAAEQGDADAQTNLGLLYVRGNGVTKDDIEAVKWYLKAAKQGDAEGQFLAGAGFDYGNGVTQDDSEAVKWYRKAAAQGHGAAQNNLARFYALGRGVPQNYLQAYIWASLASAQGLKTATGMRDILAGRLSREELSEGQRLAAAFVPREETTSSKSDNSNSQEKPSATGSGFFITSDGYVISNYHVVKDASKVRLVMSAGLVDAKVVKVDAANDLALLKADGASAPLPITSSRSVKLGGTVATVGFPNTGMQGFAPKFAKGEIASLSGASDDARYFQISVPVQPGNSGGALVDVHGNVVGIVSAKLSTADALAATGALPENVNYAVKSSFLLSFLESVPDVANKLKDPNEKDMAFDDVVKSTQDAAVMVLVY